jgi:hypothetical protein
VNYLDPSRLAITREQQLRAAATAGKKRGKKKGACGVRTGSRP